MKTETEIIRQAEADCCVDSYYLELKESDPRNALAYKYGMVTMNLAMQIRKLNK